MVLRAVDMQGPHPWGHYEGEAEIMHELAEMLPEDALIVNIGVYLGTSCLAFYEARPNAVIFGVDVAVCDDAVQHWQEAGVEPGRIIQVRGRSQEVGLYWPLPVDMVFVDGSHYGPGVEKDIELWRKVVKPGGLLIFHDYDNPVCPDVKPVIDEMMAGYTPFMRQGYFIGYRM
jgi:predicted O-methyltransferase YrrM